MGTLSVYGDGAVHCVTVQVLLVCATDVARDDPLIQQALQKVKLRSFGSQLVSPFWFVYNLLFPRG